MKKVKRVFKDDRTATDSCNCHIGRNYNPNGVNYIDDKIWNWYNQFRECPNCMMELEPIPRVCVHPNICRYKMHPVASRNPDTGRFKGRAAVETKISPDFPMSLLMSRTHLAINYKIWKILKKKFIVRPGTDAGIEAHHLDSNGYNDHPINVGLLFTSKGTCSHRQMHAQLRAYKAQFHKLLYDIQSVTEGGSQSKKIRQCWEEDKTSLPMQEKKLEIVIDKIEKLTNTEFGEDILILLDEIDDHVKAGLLWEPDWMINKLIRYNESDTNRFLAAISDPVNIGNEEYITYLQNNIDKLREEKIQLEAKLPNEE